MKTNSIIEDFTNFIEGVKEMASHNMIVGAEKYVEGLSIDSLVWTIMDNHFFPNEFFVPLCCPGHRWHKLRVSFQWSDSLFNVGKKNKTTKLAYSVEAKFGKIWGNGKIDHVETRVELGGGLNHIISFLTWIMEELKDYPEALRDVNVMIHYNGNDDFGPNATLLEDWHQSSQWWDKIMTIQTLTSYFPKLH